MARLRSATGNEGYTLFHSQAIFNWARCKDKLQFADTRLQEELEKAVTQAHLRIVEDYRAKCDSDFVQLVNYDYARKHIVAHLIGAKLGDEMFALVAMSDRWAKGREDKDESYSGYLVDLDQAWRWANEQSKPLGKEIRCALIQSSIYSLASNLFPELLRQLVETGMWSAGRALDNIEQMQDEGKRADAIKGIANLLPNNLISRTLEIAKTIARMVQPSIICNATLLTDDVRQETLSQALKRRRHCVEWYRADARTVAGN